MRQDRFEVGDLVAFVEEDPYIGAGMEERHRSRYGKGPYRVEEVEDLAQWELEIRSLRPQHRQRVTINGETYSGAWFKPLREAPAQAAA